MTYLYDKASKLITGVISSGTSVKIDKVSTGTFESNTVINLNSNYFKYDGGNIIKIDDKPGDSYIFDGTKWINTSNEKKYMFDRVEHYPSISNQLDMLFKDIENGTLDTTGKFYNAILDIKNRFPKE